MAATDSVIPTTAATASKLAADTNRGDNKVTSALDSPTNEPDFEDDEEDAAEPEEEEDEDDEEEYELDEEEDCDEEDDEASDDESEIYQLPIEKSTTSKSDTPASTTKRDSIASTTSSAKSSPKAQQQPQGNRSKQSQLSSTKVADTSSTTFKTRVFTNKSAQNRNANKQQQQQQKNQTQRKNSHESNKLKTSVLLIEEMYQPATRKASMQKSSKKVAADKDQSLSTATNPSSSGDEQTTNKNKIKATKNFPQPAVVNKSNPPTVGLNNSKNWSRKSQTFTGSNASTYSANVPPCGNPFESTTNKSPQQQRTATAKKSKPGDMREVKTNSTQMPMASGETAAIPPGRKAQTTLHQYKKLNLSDEQLVHYLHHYLLDVDSLKLLGFPVECEWNQERAVIYKPTASEFYSLRQQQRQPMDPYTTTPNTSATATKTEIDPLIPATVEKQHVGVLTKAEAATRKMPTEEDLVDDGIVTDELDLKLTNSEEDEEDEEDEGEAEEEDEDDDDSGEESVRRGEESKGLRRKRRSTLNRLSSVKLLSSSPPSSSSGNSSGIEDSSESNPSFPGSPSIARLTSPIDTIPAADEKKCSRCGRGFFVTVDGEYLTQEHCVYHYGRVQRVLNTNDNSFSFEYSCCAASPDTNGCTTHKLHVWSGLSEGFNGPYAGFVSTNQLAIGQAQDQRKGKPKVKRKLSDGPSFVFCADLDHLEGVEEKKRVPNKTQGKQKGARMVKVFALDCEMCFTGRGLELAKVTVVAHDGSLVYDKFVQPESEIIDYNTRFSGIKPSDFHPTNRHNIRSIREVQRELVEFIEEDTILIGHGLENDLRALKLIHKRIIDTSIAFPHFSGLPFRRSLKSLTKSILKRDIQTCHTGHDSYEDSLACVELMLWRVRKDFRTSHGGGGVIINNLHTVAGYHPLQPLQQPSSKRYHGIGTNSNGTSTSGLRWS